MKKQHKLFRTSASLVRIRICLVALLLCLIPITSSAKRFIVGAQDIRYMPHFDFRSETDKGIVWAILEAFGEKQGYEFEYRPLPIKRLRNELNENLVDFAYPANPKWYKQLETIAPRHYSSPFYYVLGASFTLEENKHIPFERVEVLTVPFGFSPVKWRERIESKQVSLAEVSDSFSALNLLISRRADAADLEYNVVKYLATKYPKYQEITFSPSLPYDVVGFHLSTINFPEVTTELNQFLRENQSLVESLKQQYQLIDPNSVIEAK